MSTNDTDTEEQNATNDTPEQPDVESGSSNTDGEHADAESGSSNTDGEHADAESGPSNTDGEHADAESGSSDEDRELTWEEAASGFQRRLEERRTVGVEVPDLGVAEFTLRGLTREERDEVEQAAATVNQHGRGEPEVEVDTGAIRRKMLEYGIVEGPAGFKPEREDHLQQLPPGVQDELVDIVEDLSTLSVEEYDGFQEMG